VTGVPPPTVTASSGIGGRSAPGGPAGDSEAARWWRRPEPGWSVVLSGDEPSRRRSHAALLTVADGRIGTRGAREECWADRAPWVIAAGGYRQAEDHLPRPPPGPPVGAGAHSPSRLPCGRPWRTGSPASCSSRKSR